MPNLRRLEQDAAKLRHKELDPDKLRRPAEGELCRLEWFAWDKPFVDVTGPVFYNPYEKRLKGPLRAHHGPVGCDRTPTGDEKATMGVWGDEAWEGDGAADWLGDTVRSGRLPQRVERALKADPQEDAETIRAAAWLLLQLGRVYVWPIERFQADLELAAGDDPESQLAKKIKSEIRVLRKRAQPLSDREAQ